MKTPKIISTCSVGRPRPIASLAPQHRTLRIRNSAIIILISLFALTTTLNARVFMRWGGSSDTINNLARLGGKTAYTSDITINNGQGKLTVMGFDDSRNNTASQILHTLNLTPDTTQDNNSANLYQQISPTTSLYILHGKTTTLRLILLQLPQSSRLIAIAIEQSNADFKKSQNAPASHKLKAIPAYPGSTPKFYAESSETKLHMAMSSSSDNTETIHSHYHSILKSDGWMPYLSDTMGSIPQMTIYQRNSELCYILAIPAKFDQNIAIVYKQLSL